MAACAQLADVVEMRSPAFRTEMEQINAFARTHGLRTFETWSKIWEYPWLWLNTLRNLDHPRTTVLDLGSELSPIPWMLAARGSRVHLIETDPQWVPTWERVRAALKVNVSWDLVDAEALPLPDASIDIVTSLSVIEHQQDKPRAVTEVARVLKPGGIFALSFDICEPELGMTFPFWNGSALTRSEFEHLIWRHPAFDGVAVPAWNDESIQPFLDWHRTTAPHHNYIVGAARLCKRVAPAV